MAAEPLSEYIPRRYDLSDEDIQHLTAQLIAERPPASNERFICYRLEGDDHLSDIARNVERTVFERTFEGNDAEELAQEYGPYESASTFFISVDTTNRIPTGALRVIKNSSHGFKSLNDLEETDLHLTPEEVFEHYDIKDKNTVWDIGTVAVLPEFRSGEGSISVQLYRALYVSAMEQGVEHFVSIIDEKPLKKLTGYLGIPFEHLMGTGPFAYLGSKSSQAVHGYAQEFYKKMNRKRYTIKGLLARKALNRLVKGSEDHTLQL